MKIKILYALLLALVFSGSAMAGRTGHELYQSLTTPQKDKALKIIQLYEDYKKCQDTPMTPDEKKDLADFASEIKEYEKLPEAEKLKFIEWLQTHDMININTRNRNRGARETQTPAEKAQINLDSARRWLRLMTDEAKAEFIKFAPEYLKTARTGQYPYFADQAKMKEYIDFQKHVDMKWSYVPQPDRVELISLMLQILKTTQPRQATRATASANISNLSQSNIQESDPASQRVLSQPQRELLQQIMGGGVVQAGSYFIPPLSSSQGSLMGHLINRGL